MSSENGRSSQAPRDMVEAHARLRTLLESVPDLIYFKDREGRHLAVNKAFADFCGTTADAIQGKTNDDLLPPDLAAHCNESDHLAMDEKRVVQLEETMTGPGGVTVYFDTIKSPIFDEDGTVTGLVGVSREITLRKVAEQRIEQSEEKYRTLAESATDCIYIVGKDGRAVYANPATQQFLELSANEIAGHRLEELLPPEPAAALGSRVQEMLKTGDTFELTHCVRLGTKETWFDTNLVPILNEAGRITGVLGISRDVTERQVAVQQRNLSEARYRTIVEDMPNLVCRYTPEGQLTFVNDAYCQCFGRRKEDLQGKAFMPMIPEEDRRGVDYIIGTLGQDNPVVTYEHRVVMPDGEVRWQEWTDRALFDETGRIVEYQAIGNDVTQQKHAEEQLRNSRDQLKALTRRLQALREEERTIMAHTIHDEFGQALTAIKMNVASLLKKLDPADETLHQRGGETLEMIDELVHSVQHLSMGLRPSMLDHLGLPDAIAWETEQFRKRADWTIELNLDRTIELKPEQKTALFRVYQELLTNVARHAHATKIEVTLKRELGMVVLIVRDDGRGIKEEDITKPTAFGLAEVRERVSRWHGEVKFEGVPNERTTVTVGIRHM